MDSREVIADKIAEICDIITFKTDTTMSEKGMLVGEMMVLAGMIGQDVLRLADEYYRGIRAERLDYDGDKDVSPDYFFETNPWNKQYVDIDINKDAKTETTLPPDHQYVFELDDYGDLRLVVKKVRGKKNESKS